MGNASVGIARTGTTAQGTLTIQAVNGHLGTSEDLVSPVVLGLSTITQLSALDNNGMVAASIVSADGSGNASFVKYGTPAQGFVAATPTLTNTFVGSNAASIVAIASGNPQTLTGVNTAYAVSSSANISGGTLQIISDPFTGTAVNVFEGGLLLNGGAGQTVSSNLFFGNATSSYLAAPYPLSPGILVTPMAVGEGIVYVNGTATAGATLSGQVVANNFTKFGPGSLTLSGNDLIAGSFAVQQGVVKFINEASGPIAGSLVLDDLGTLDINSGTTLAANLVGGQSSVVGTFIGNLSGTQGIIGNSSVTANGAVIIVGQGSTTYSGNIVDGINGGNEKTILVRGGGGTLILGPLTANNSFAGDNTYTGGTVINSGTLTIQNPYALGGYNNTTPGAVTLNGGTLNFDINTTAVDSNVVIGNPALTNGGININVTNNAAIAVTGFSTTSGSGSNFIVNNLTIGNQVLTLSGVTATARVKVMGTTTLVGNTATITMATAAPLGMMELAGVITDGGNGYAVDKGGSGTGVLIISGTANTYSGGTNVFGGAIQVTAISGTPLGTGPVIVDPGAFLRLAGAGSIGSAYGGSTGISSLSVLSTFTSLGAIGLDNSFDPSSILTSTNGAGGAATLNSIWGSSVMLETPNFTTSLNMANIGNGKQFLGAGFTIGNVDYLGATLGGGQRQCVSPGREQRRRHHADFRRSRWRPHWF